MTKQKLTKEQRRFTEKLKKKQIAHYDFEKDKTYPEKNNSTFVVIILVVVFLFTATAVAKYLGLI